MVAANLSKGGGLLLLSCCSRRGGLRPLLSLVKGNWKCEGGALTTAPPSLSLSISTLNGKGVTTVAAARRRVFCTASSNVAEDSSAAAVSTTTNDEEKDDAMVLKDAANTLDIKVGQIVRAWRHEEADSLFVEEVDVGEPQPRIICSGLVKYMPLDLLQGKKVVVLANLKPRNMRGVKSFGMLMAASDASHENVELLVPPESSLPGERVWFGSADEIENLPEPATPNQIQKKKIWELVQPHLRTDASCVATLGMHFMRTSADVVVCGSLKNANIS